MFGYFVAMCPFRVSQMRPKKPRIPPGVDSPAQIGARGLQAVNALRCSKKTASPKRPGRSRIHGRAAIYRQVYKKENSRRQAGQRLTWLANTGSVYETGAARGNDSIYKPIHRRTAMLLRSLMLVSAILCGLLQASPALSQATKIAVGYPPAPDFLPAYVAKEKGYFDKRGLDVSMTRIALGSNIPAAMVAGSLQIGMGSATVLFDAVEGGLDLVVIAGAARFPDKTPNISIVARTGSKVSGARDLEGKKLGVPGVRNIMDVLFRKWMVQKGASPDKVSYVEASFPQMGDMLKGGVVDAVVVLDPFRSKMISDGTGVKVADFIAELGRNILATFWTAKNDWARANPQAVQGFRAALTEGIDFIEKNPDEAKKIEQKYLGLTSPIWPVFSVSLETADLQLYADVYKQFGMSRQPIDVSKLILR
jgi:NitT/TauT family transport system substrate-binding protein